MNLFSGVTDVILNTAFRPGGIVNLNKLDAEEFEKIPLLRQIRCLCEFIQREGRMKLTNTGSLPLRVVKEMFEVGVRDWYYEKYPNKRIKESDSKNVQFSRELAKLTGIIRTRNNELYLTKKGEKLLSDPQKLLETVIDVFVHKFNHDAYDGYQQFEGLGSRDAALSLIIFDQLQKEMPESKPKDTYYAMAYFNTRPEMYINEESERCYIYRTFDNFMENFGLVTTEDIWHHTPMKHETIITPTALFKKMIRIEEDYNRVPYVQLPDLKIYQIRVSLRDSDPLIWRRLQLPSTMLLSDFHLVIQDCMGWTNSHLHEFEKENVIYTDFMDDELASIQKMVPYQGMMLCELMVEKGERIVYRYDFGDDWIHDVELEGIFSPIKETIYPIFLAGEWRCPPEDCGGLDGYYDMLDILNDPDHPEKEDYLAWLGGEFNAGEMKNENYVKQLHFKM